MHNNKNLKIRLSSQVLSQQVGDEIVLMDLKNGRYLGLDEIASHIWSMLNTGATHEDIMQNLLMEYEVDRDRLTNDVDQLIQQLVDKGLIELFDEP